MREITVKKLYKETNIYDNQNITIEGWVKSLRDSKTFKSFLMTVYLILKK